MALAPVEFDATNGTTGALMANVEARVEIEGGGLVSIYSDRAGTIPYSNPQTFADGHVFFFVAGGAYKITLTSGAYSRVRRYVANGLLAEKDELTAAAIGALAIVADRTALAASDSTTVLYLNEGERAGEFGWASGDLSARVAADPLQGLYVPRASDPTGATGAFVRQGTWLFDGLHPEWFGAVGDSTTDDSAAFQAVIDIIGDLFTSGAQISLQSKTYALANGLVGISSIAFVGANATAIWGAGATLLNTQTGTPEPMFSFTQNIAGVRFENVRIDGDDIVAPAIAVYEGGGTFGGYGFQFINVQFHHCIPAIYAEYSFDWVIDRCMFNECGDGAGAGNEIASMYFKNSGPTAGNTNDIHISNCFIDLSDGIGIYSDDTGASGSTNLAFYVLGNHFETHDGSGFEAVKGVLASSFIQHNLCWITDNSFIVLEAGGGSNTVAGNRFFQMGDYAVETHGASDLIAHNHSFKSTAVTDHYLVGAAASGARVHDNAMTGTLLSSVGVTDSGSGSVVTQTLPQRRASSFGPASLDLHEDTDNGASRVRIIAPASLSADRTLTLLDADLTLGTAAGKNTGTSGNNVPLLDGANTWSAQQIFSLSSSFAIPAQFVSTSADAVPGPVFFLDRNSASPAAADVLASLRFQGRDSGGGSDPYAILEAAIVDPTATSEDGRLDVYAAVAGATTVIARFGPRPYMTNVTTTAAAANAVIDNASSPVNELLRSTSSLRYKREVETLEPQFADAILSMRPIWYRSVCEHDNPQWSWYGLAAEEVAAIDPRLVNWGYAEDDFEEVLTLEEGEVPALEEVDGEMALVVRKHRYGVKRHRQLKAGVVPRPDGVQYERLSVMLLSIVQRQEERIRRLEERFIAPARGKH